MNLPIGLLALAICLSSLSSKAAGLAWLWMVVGGLLVWLKSYRQPIQTRPLLPGRELGIQIANWWILACALAMVMMLIPTAYWSGPWPERHPQWRMLLGAVGVWWLLRYSPPIQSALRIWASAAAISSLLAYGLVVAASSNEAPTNRIPWMAGLSLLSCALLTLSFALKDAPLKLRQFWLAASALMLVTVLLSGVRGSFPLLLIWPLTLLAMHRSVPSLWQRSWRWLLPLMIFLFVLGLPLIPEGDNPLVRVLHVLRETGAIAVEGSAQPETSSGIRSTLYRTALQHVFDHPLWGMGPTAAKALIVQALMAAGMTDPAVVFGIGHFHSDLLNPWVEFGLWGLMGYVSYLGGMLFIAWRLKCLLAQPVMAFGMLALALVHLATGLSNVNLAHNYYPTMLAISMGLILFCVSDSDRSVSP